MRVFLLSADARGPMPTDNPVLHVQAGYAEDEPLGSRRRGRDPRAIERPRGYRRVGPGLRPAEGRVTLPPAGPVEVTEGLLFVGRLKGRIIGAQRGFVLTQPEQSVAPAVSPYKV